MDRQLRSPDEVGMIAYGGQGLSLHRITLHYKDPRYNTMPTGCGRWIKSFTASGVDYLDPTRVCRICFGRPGAAFFNSVLDPNVIIEFFDQTVLDGI